MFDHPSQKYEGLIGLGYVGIGAAAGTVGFHKSKEGRIIREQNKRLDDSKQTVHQIAIRDEAACGQEPPDCLYTDTRAEIAVQSQALLEDEIITPLTFKETENIVGKIGGFVAQQPDNIRSGVRALQQNYTQLLDDSYQSPALDTALGAFLIIVAAYAGVVKGVPKLTRAFMRRNHG